MRRITEGIRVRPAVAIHREVTSYDRDDLGAALLKFFLAGFQITGATSRRGVASIGERVNEDFTDARIMSCIRKRNHVRVVAVDATVGNQSE